MTHVILYYKETGYAPYNQIRFACIPIEEFTEFYGLIYWRFI